VQAGEVGVRLLRPEDKDAWVRLRAALWPDVSAAEHGVEAERFLSGEAKEPQAVLVAESPGHGLVGFAEISIRAYAEGCSTDRVGYLEGWFVAPAARRRGTGRALASILRRTWALRRATVPAALRSAFRATPGTT